MEGGDSISYSEAFDQTYRVNVRSGFLGSHHFRKLVGTRSWDASILFVGSVNSLHASPGHTAYDGSKGAVLIRTRSFVDSFEEGEQRLRRSATLQMSRGLWPSTGWRAAPFPTLAPPPLLRPSYRS